MEGHTIVIPCHNEADRLSKEAVIAFVDHQPQSHVVLVNDCSVDKTAEVIREIEQLRPGQIRAIDRNELNGSKAEAVRMGILDALTRWDDPWLGFLDADLSTHFDELTNMFAVLQEKPTVGLILGARVKLFGRTISRSSSRHYFGRVFATMVSILFDLEVYDTQCGAKLVRRDIAEIAFKDPFVTKWLFDVELILRVREHVGSAAFENTMVEVPLRRWVDQGDSRIRPKDLFFVPIDLARIKLREAK